MRHRCIVNCPDISKLLPVRSTEYWLVHMAAAMEKEGCLEHGPETRGRPSEAIFHRANDGSREASANPTPLAAGCALWIPHSKAGRPGVAALPFYRVVELDLPTTLRG